MEPPIQYAKTKDGVNIAYTTMGEGPVLVHQPWPYFGNVQLEMGQARYYHWYKEIAERHTLVRYDRRGTGLSDRDVTDFSLEAQVADLEAVVDRLALDRFALFSLLALCPTAIVYAARRPERVSHLVLWSGSARGADSTLSPRIVALTNLMESDWDLFARSFVLEVIGWEEPEAASVVRLIKEGIEPQVWRQSIDAMQMYDVEDLLSDVKAPTLVVHGRQNRRLAISVAKTLASRISNAHLSVQNSPGPPWRGDVDSNLRTILEFLSDGEYAPGTPMTTPASSETAIILFADIAASTALTEELGDAAFREKARSLDEALRDAITSAGGTAIEGKLLGDGVLATFNAAHEAIACAAACHDAGSDVGLSLHVGIHAGDVIREDDNVFGGAVNVAARISDASAAGETLVSGTVRELARTSAGVSFEDRGERAFKGVSEPVRVWAVVK